MTLLYRRLTYISFIIIFLVVTPLIIAYTAGYRYNFSKGRVQKTGILRITSVPRGAGIYLNGQAQSRQTPAKIQYLMPGDYEIKLAKEGYLDWQKKLPITENNTTFAEKIILWKKSVAEKLNTTTSASSWLISPDKNIAAFSQMDGSIGIIDVNSGLFGELSGGSLEIIAQITDYNEVKLTSYSPTGRYLIAEGVKSNAKTYFLIDAFLKKYDKLPIKSYSAVKWDKNSDTLYANDKAGLWQIDVSNLTAKQILKNITADFYFDGQNLYTFRNSVLSRGTPVNADTNVITTINCDACRIETIKGNRLYLFNRLSGELRVIDLAGKAKTASLKAKSFDFLADDSALIYNDFELAIYNSAKDEPELITRLGQPVTAAAWHPTGRYIFFATEGQLKVIELDNRELRNIITIAEAPANFIQLDRAGNNLYFSSPADEQAGIYKLAIQ
ncbi:MAG: PEGA domain-containing protein [Patescibacteria group bacterium]|jgi:WD40 repeat protein